MSKTFVGSFPKQPPAPKVKRKRSNRQVKVKGGWTEPAMREVVMARPRCEVASVVCTGRVEHAHHIRMRSQGGSHDPENVLAACQPCHEVCHANPEQSYRDGWLRRRYPRDGDFHFQEPGVAS